MLEVGVLGTCVGVDGAPYPAAHGWTVLPVAGMAAAGCTCGRKCDSAAKNLLTPHRAHDASTDPAHIRRWWQRRTGSIGRFPRALHSLRGCEREGQPRSD